MRLLVLLFAIVVSITLSACGGDDESDRTTTTASPARSSAAVTVTPKEGAMEFTLTSDAFTDGEAIPARFTCDCDDVSTALKWQGVADEGQAPGRIMDARDAPG